MLLRKYGVWIRRGGGRGAIHAARRGFQDFHNLSWEKMENRQFSPPPQKNEVFWTDCARADQTHFSYTPRSAKNNLSIRVYTLG